MRSRLIKWGVGLLLAAAVLATAGTWGYINLVRGEAPQRLTLDAARVPTGQTHRGNTRTVRIELAAQRSTASVRVAGRVPMVFAEWGIPDPSFGLAQTEDNGELEFLLLLSR